MAEPATPPAAGGKGSVKLFGQHMSKKTLMIAGAVGAGVLGYAWYRKSKNTAASGGTASAGQIDPVTGYPEGSAEDTAALQSQASGGLNTGALSGMTDPQTGLPLGSTQDEQALQDMGLGGTGGTLQAGVPAPSVTIAQWEQECIANLEAGGVAQSVISDAEAGLPRYLAHLSLPAAQATAVQMAVGLTGPPPGGGTYSIIPAPPAHKPPAKPPVTKPPVTHPPTPHPPVPHRVAAKTIDANGRDTLERIADGAGIPETELIDANPRLRERYYGSGKPLPKGTRVHIPAHEAK